MIRVRRSEERGGADYGWLKAKHSFSFGNYYDPQHTHYRTLRVINEDRVQPGRGFPTHPHRDMEIITYVMEGALEHKDSMGNGSVVQRFEAQYMSAGRGVTHSEYNPSESEVLKLFQIWIEPNRKGLEPRYAQGLYDPRAIPNSPLLVASPDGALDSLSIHQQAWFSVLMLEAGSTLEIELARAPYSWWQLASGELETLDTVLQRGDAAVIEDKERVTVAARQDSFVLYFELR